MQRKFLEDLGLDKDNIDKVLNQYKQDLEKAKQPLIVERDSLKDQLETAQDVLKEFDGVDVKDLQGKIDNLNTELANKDKEERYQNNTYSNGNDHSEEYTGTDRVTAGRTRSRSQNHRQHTQNECQRCHQNRSETQL